MKYLIFGCLLIALGIAAWQHEPPSQRLQQLDHVVHSEHTNQSNKSNKSSKSLVKFVTSPVEKIDSLVNLEAQKKGEG